MQVANVLCDMVENRLLRGMKSCNSTYGCLFCTGAMVRKSWPSSTAASPLRTEAESKYYARFVNSFWKTCEKFLKNNFSRENPRAPETMKKDIVCDSPIYDLRGVDYVWGLPLDVFHNGFEGVAKLKMIRMLLTKKTKEAREVLAELNLHYEAMTVFSETARTTRAVTQVLSLKGNELKVLSFSVFPVLATSIIRHDIPVW